LAELRALPDRVALFLEASALAALLTALVTLSGLAILPGRKASAIAALLSAPLFYLFVLLAVFVCRPGALRIHDALLGDVTIGKTKEASVDSGM
jgi:hypothetical protein